MFIVFTIMGVLYRWLDTVDLSSIEFIESLNNIAFLQSIQEVPDSVSRLLIKNEKVAVAFSTLQKTPNPKVLEILISCSI